jgi:hypothetical protein
VRNRFREIAILRGELVDGLEDDSKEARPMLWIGSMGSGHGLAPKELVDQRAASLGVVEEGRVASWHDLEVRIG